MKVLVGANELRGKPTTIDGKLSILTVNSVSVKHSIILTVGPCQERPLQGPGLAGLLNMEPS